MGNTFDAQGAGSVITVHPHACGEYFRSSHCLLISAGSSPRVWGILGWRRVYVRLTRFIPTRVGNTPGLVIHSSGIAVHPHACGEYLGRRQSRKVKPGSSPRVWGIPPSEPCNRGASRFIPTRVGNTPFSSFPQPGQSVHPHACGEYGFLRWIFHAPGGSSPRVWGIPSRPRHSRPSIAVHPHACGEYYATHQMFQRWYGSSPRVWGIRCRERPRRLPRRFIPTRVGNTF